MASSAQSGDAPVLARVFVAKDAVDADVLRIRSNIVSFGGVVKGYARGDVFVVSAAPQALAAIASVHKVVKVDRVPGAADSAWRVQGALLQPTLPTRLAQAARSCVATPTPEQAKLMESRVLLSAAIAPTPFSRRLSLLGASNGLPAQVDNSLSPHFPPIGDQEGHPTCVAWAASYYWSTYTQAADEGLDVSGTWLPRDPPCDILTNGEFDAAKFALCVPTIKDPPRPSRATEHIASPAFLYPLIRVAGTDLNGNPTDDGGAFLDDAMWRIGMWGNGSWQMKPYEPWKFDPLVYEWPTEAQWIEAMPRRTAASFRLALATDSGFADLKQHLANGHLAVVSFTPHENYGTWGWDRSCQDQPGACPGIAGDVVYSDGGTKAMGKHAVTIVGYDDDRAYYDAEAREIRQGALLVANSATPAWGVANSAGGPTQGFFWMAYGHARSKFGTAYYNSDRAGYRPRMYASVRLAPNDRAFGALSAGVGVMGAGYGALQPRYELANAYPSSRGWGGRPFEADKRMVVDLTDGLSKVDLSAGVPLLYVAFSSSSGGTVGPADFFVDRTGIGSFMRLASPDPVKAATATLTDAQLCTAATPSPDVDGNGVVDRIDVAAITASIISGRPVCKSDPRDFDRDGRITVIDARNVAVRCTYAGCAKR